VCLGGIVVRHCVRPEDRRDNPCSHAYHRDRRHEVAPSGGQVPYALFVFAGLVPWTSFANAVGTAGNSLVNSAGLVTKVFFPRLLVPMAAVAASFVDFLLPCGILLGMLVYYRVPPTAHLALLPVLVLMTHLFALAVGTRLAALNVKYRDVRFVLPFLIQIWMFVSSVILPSTSVPAKYRWILVLNPMSGFIEGYRSALFGQPFDWRSLAIATVLTAAVFIYSAYSFRKAERVFADII